jgi:hypothetical protein
MKVWELMRDLGSLRAGADVFVSAYPAGTLNELSRVTVEKADIIYLNGDGRYTDELDVARDA